MSKNSNIKLISASIDDELLLVELMKKYHLYDGIEMTDEDRLAALSLVIFRKGQRLDYLSWQQADWIYCYLQLLQYRVQGD
ncbi:hypothetical protein [Pseudomonas aeruginosa]|uniref:hypothetical protein n=1 Tax=Pseudomonas aeruginosa TaxID=287 RepID=UPI003D06A248